MAETIRIGRLRPGDLGAIRRGLAELGAETLYRRFLRVVPADRVDLAWTSELDGPRHVAYGACAAATGDPLGLARAVVVADRAELAVTVIDRWQGQRVGTRLSLVLLSDLRSRGVGLVVATVAYENRAAMAVCRRLGARSAGPVEAGVVEMQLALARDHRRTTRASGANSARRRAPESNGLRTTGLTSAGPIRS
jgi:GNAT superfamily N-acetyltransferase